MRQIKKWSPSIAIAITRYRTVSSVDEEEEEEVVVVWS